MNKFLNLVIVLGCVVFAFFFFQYKTEKENLAVPQKVDQSSIRPDVDPQELANKYLQEAQQNLATDKLKASINIKKAIADSEQAVAPPKVVETDPSQVSADQQIWKDPNANQSLEKRFSEEVNSHMNNTATSELDKAEYIRQFKENARKNGYEITVNDDLEVTSVTPIRKPQNQKNDYDSNSSEAEY